jgi:hypothetical protein
VQTRSRPFLFWGIVTEQKDAKKDVTTRLSRGEHTRSSYEISAHLGTHLERYKFKLRDRANAFKRAKQAS